MAPLVHQNSSTRGFISLIKSPSDLHTLVIIGSCGSSHGIRPLFWVNWSPSAVSSFETGLSEIRDYLDPAFDLRQCHPLSERNESRLDADYSDLVFADEEYTRCVNPLFLPRVLSTRQISWRSSHGASGQDTKGGSKGNATDSANRKGKKGGGENGVSNTGGEDDEAGVRTV